MSASKKRFLPKFDGRPFAQHIQGNGNLQVGHLQGELKVEHHHHAQTQSRQRLFDVFPESVHAQLQDVLARCEVSAADVSLAQRMGALHAVDGRIRRKGRVVDQTFGWLLLLMAFGLSILIAKLTLFSHLPDALQGLAAVSAMALSMVALVGSIFYPQRVAAKVERFLVHEAHSPVDGA